MKITLEISSEDYNTLKLLTSNGINGSIEDNIKNAIKFYIVNDMQYIPYIQKHQKWIMTKDRCIK